MSKVVLHDVTKTYPAGHRALVGLSLEVRAGELLVLAGPSGCGKSTTLRLIAGLDRPTSGTLHIAGKPMDRVPPRDRDVAMVFQNYALYPHMSARQNIAFPLRGRGLPRAEADSRVTEIAHTLALDAVLAKKPAQLSGGERQRVALARALVRRPGVLLLDEPFSNLDPRLRATARAELRALQQRLGTTTLHVTHDHDEAMTLGDRLAILGDGVLHQIATPLEVYARPANRFVASMLGSPGMNFLPGTIERAEGSLWFREDAPAYERLRIPPPAHVALESRVGQPVVLGFRPHHLRPAPPDSPDLAIALHLTPTLIQRHGDHTTLHARSRGGSTIVARLPDAVPPPSIGVEIPCLPDPANLHWFQPGPVGRNLLT